MASTGSIHFSGLGSNIDVDDLISQLYKVESIKAEKLISWRDDWQTRLTAFQTLRAELLNLQTTLTSMNTVDKFLVKSASSSNTGVVSATVDSDASEGVYSLEVNQLATNSVWSINSGYSSKDEVINDTGSMGSFTYTYKGEQRTVNVPSGTTLEGLKNIINNDSGNKGVRVQLIESSEGVVFQLRGLDTGLAASLSIDETTNISGLEVQTQATWTAAGTNTLTTTAHYSSASSKLNDTATSKTFVFNVNGQETSVKLKAGGTLEELRDSINAESGTSGVTASIVSDVVDGNTVYRLQLSTTNPSDQLSIGSGTLAGFSGMTEATNWQSQAGQNAEIRVNGWPAETWLERDSNAVTGVADGVTFNLRSVGTASVAVELDTEAIEANVQSFVDAVNAVRITLQSLTAVDEEKTTYDPDYAETQYEMQKGSVLTGNYGVQMLASNLKMLIAGQAAGFTYRSTSGGLTTGDLFSSLSQIGVTTNADQGSSNYGLLEINDVEGLYGSLTLSEALAKDPEAVARLFAANSDPVTDSSYFQHNSHIAGITEAGTYEVSYTTDSSGNIISATINGKEAKIEDNGRQIGIYSTQQPPNTADGLVLDIYDLTPDQTFTGTISIQNGKVNELLNMMDGSEGLLGEDGTLRILEKNYQDIIDNIEAKVKKEDERLQRWENNMRNRFARLESVLTTYNTMYENLKTQLEQLNSSS